MYSQTTEIPTGIKTPDKVETSIATLEFFDGAPMPGAVKLITTKENLYLQ